MTNAHSEVTTPQVVLVLGKTGVGKSTFIKAAASLDVEVGHSLDSCTHEVQMYWVPDTKIFLIDTPGFDDPTRSDADILQSIASCLADLHEGLIFDGRGVDLSGVIYIHSIDEPRMTGTMMQNLKMFRNLVGDENMKHCVLLTTKWSLQNDAKLAQDRESELINSESYWKDNIAAEAIVKRFSDTKTSAIEILGAVTRNGSFMTKLTVEYVIEGRSLIDTSAGRAINKDLADIRARQESGLSEIREEYTKAINARDENLSNQLAKLWTTAEEKLQKLDEDSTMLAATREEAQQRLEDLELQKASPLLSIQSCDSTTPEDERARRQRRAMRWFVRFATLGTAATITGLSHGALAPVAISLVFGIETILQKMKDREIEAGKSSESVELQ